LLLYGRFDLLKTSFGLIKGNYPHEFDQFILKAEVLSRRQEVSLKLNRGFNYLLTFFGFDGRSHLLY